VSKSSNLFMKNLVFMNDENHVSGSKYAVSGQINTHCNFVICFSLYGLAVLDT